MSANRTTSSPPKLPRVAVVIPKYGLVGGSERFAFEVTERLARSGHYEMHVFANRWQAADGSPVVFHRVPLVKFPRSLRPWSFAWFAQRMIARGEFDLAHSHDRLFHADLFSLHGVPHAGWVRDVRNKTPSLFDHAIMAIERRMIANGAKSWFLPVSSLAQEMFRQEYGNLPGRWQVMHPGVNVTRFATPDRRACREAIRQHYGIAETDFLLMFVGMNFEVKGLDSILSAIARTRATQPYPAIRLLVVGKGNEARYRKLAQSLGVADAIVFAGEQTTGLEQYYRAADALILLSAFDTFGMVVLEAMAAGLPVVVSSNVGAKDIVEDGINGFVIQNARDADETANRIMGILDGLKRKIMGDAAAHSSTIHTWERLAAELDVVYQTILRNNACLRFENTAATTEGRKQHPTTVS